MALLDGLDLRIQRAEAIYGPRSADALVFQWPPVDPSFVTNPNLTLARGIPANALSIAYEAELAYLANSIDQLNVDRKLFEMPLVQLTSSTEILRNQWETHKQSKWDRAKLILVQESLRKNEVVDNSVFLNLQALDSIC